MPTTKVANNIRRGLEQAVAYAMNEGDLRRYRGHVLAAMDVRKIRTKPATMESVTRDPGDVDRVSAVQPVEGHEDVGLEVVDPDEAVTSSSRPAAVDRECE